MELIGLGKAAKEIFKLSARALVKIDAKIKASIAKNAELKFYSELSSLYKGRTAKASELIDLAESRGWTLVKGNGLMKFIDEHGNVRLKIKQGSSRTLGSEMPHLEIRSAHGRVDINGNRVSRTSRDNHTPIKWDLKNE